VTNLATYSFALDVDGATPQIGNKRGVGVLIVTTADDGSDPPVPTLAGAGASEWLQGASTPGGTGTTRRRATPFYARDAVGGAAAPLVVTLSGAGRHYTGCIAHGFKTTGTVPSTWKTLAQSKSVARQSLDSGESATAPRCTLAAADDAANRPVVWVVDNGSTAEFTPDADFEMVGTELPMTGPTLRSRILDRDDAFETTPTSSFGASVVWMCLGTESEQG
jgi:hypothetical protein